MRRLFVILALTLALAAAGCNNEKCERRLCSDLASGSNDQTYTHCLSCDGDGTCDPGEDCTTCSADCPCSCGDGLCTSGEQCVNCPGDCACTCGGTRPAGASRR